MLGGQVAAEQTAPLPHPGDAAPGTLAPAQALGGASGPLSLTRTRRSVPAVSTATVTAVDPTWRITLVMDSWTIR
ncbi:hypothetical protein [Nocardia thailandica]|uniref:Uncharacterized protein n=1 Tax=Nocardia thailandica TaxID=257275 RepID=A0ABW6PMM3_9NOCA